MPTLLENLANWNQKADAGETNLYCRTDDAQFIEDGQCNLVLGRKGSGKSALLNHVERRHERTGLFYRITFNPSVLRVWAGSGTNQPLNAEQYEILWTAFIYSSICKEAVNRGHARGLLRDALAIRHDVSTHTTLLKAVRSLLGARKIRIGLPYVEFEHGVAPSQLPQNPSDPQLLRLINSASQDVLKICRASKKQLFILCDEIDLRFESRRDLMRFQQYLECIKGLLLAANSISDFAASNKAQIRPVIAMRADIYEQVHLPQMNAFRSRKLQLNPSVDAIEQILAYRICQSLPDFSASRPLGIADAWRRVFYDGDAGGRRFDSKAFMRDRTLNRVRDYVEFFRLAAIEQLTIDPRRKLISRDALIAAYLKFVDFLVTEFVDELCFKYDFGIGLVDVFRSMYGGPHAARENFSYVEFKKKCGEYSINLTEQDFKSLVRDLYRMSVIGFQEPTPTGYRATVFRFLSPDTAFPANFWDAPIGLCLHTGFRAALSRLQVA